ncbi:MAG: MATE family efflux transporter, partial [Pseudomonadota bacterium]
PFAIAVYALTGWLIAMERTRGVLILQVWMNGLNIGLDLLFVLGFGWGVEGVAAATLIAEASAAGLGLWMCRAAFTGEQWRDWARVFDRARLRRMAQVNGDILIRSMLLQIGFAFFLFQSARLGDVPLAANQILFQFVHITAFALDGFAFAAEALVGQAFGARRAGALRRASILTSQWGLVCVVLLGAGFLVLGAPLIDLMTTAPEVREAARAFLPWVVVAPLLGLPAFMLDGIFIGATRTRDMRNGMIISLPVYLLAWAVLTPLFATHGLWAALMIFFAARGVTLGLRYPALERATAG